MACLACEGPDTRASTHLAADFAPQGHSVSVLGVFKDGRLTTDGWDVIASRLSPVLGESACPSGYTDAFVAANPELASTLDDYARANGPTDDMLTELAPAADGDLVVVFTVAGRLPVQEKTSLAASEAAAAGRGPTEHHENHRDPNALDLAAQIFSVKQGRSVGVVDIEYRGASVKEAIGNFANRVRAALPGAHCVGWTWAGKMDPAVVRRKLGE